MDVRPSRRRFGLGSLRVLKYGSYFAVLAALYITAGLLYALSARDTGNVAYETFREKARHANESIGPRRLLLVGGSNVLWGYRSSILQSELGIPTTNLGLASEGGDPRAVRELILSIARPGDIIVYSTIAFWNTSEINPDTARALLSAAGLSIADDRIERLKSTFASHWSWTPPTQPLIFDLPRLYRRYFTHEPNEQLAQFNEYGDNKACRSAGFNPQKFAAPTASDKFIRDVRTFRENLRSKGADLVFDVSWLNIANIESEIGEWERAFQPQLDRLRREVPVTTSTIGDVVSTNAGLFCDTVNHLSEESAIIRTQNLAFILKGWLGLDDLEAVVAHETAIPDNERSANL